MSELIDNKESSYLYLDVSQIENAGKGLFTSIPIYKDEVICLFHGEILDNKEMTRRFREGNDAYFIDMNDGTTMDCLHIPGKAKYANDANGFSKTRFKNNAMITFDDDDRVCLAATRSIKKGEEIFCSYGKEYWKKFREERKKNELISHK